MCTLFQRSLIGHSGSPLLAPNASNQSFTPTSSVPSTRAGGTSGGKAQLQRKGTLPEQDKVNFDRAFEHLVNEIIHRLGWGNEAVKIAGPECLSQASAENAARVGLSSFLYSGRNQYSLATEPFEF